MGKFISDRRKDLGMSQAELARRIGIKQPSLHAIESGKTRSLKATTLEALAVELRTTTAAILGAQTDGSSKRDGLVEGELVFILRKLSAQRRVQLLEYARFLLTNQPPAEAPAEHEPAKVAPLKPKKQE